MKVNGDKDLTGCRALQGGILYDWNVVKSTDTQTGDTNYTYDEVKIELTDDRNTIKNKIVAVQAENNADYDVTAFDAIADSMTDEIIAFRDI
jgi:hypothetical protein